MRRPSVFLQRNQQLDVKMTPMIDVVFMLLIFFVWTASFQIVEQILPSSLLTSSQGQGQTEIDPEMEDLERVVVQLLWNAGRPSWRINETPVSSLSEVRSRLAAVARINTALPVLVDAAEEIPLGYVIDVYDLARQAGFQKVQFAVNERI